MELELFQAENGPCPYRSTGLWVSYSFDLKSIQPAFYEQLMQIGFRRSGLTFYKNNCPGCHDCIPIRIPVNRFRLSKSQRRNLRKNSDIRISRSPVRLDMDGYKLYSRYIQDWHKAGDPPSFEEYYHFLVTTPLETQMIRYFYLDKLIGISWIDLLPRSLSSVYFAFDPEFSRRGLGVYSLLKEIEYCQKWNKTWLFLGFWVQDSPNMAYKNQYRPYELLIDGEWKQYEDRDIPGKTE